MSTSRAQIRSVGSLSKLAGDTNISCMLILPLMSSVLSPEEKLQSKALTGSSKVQWMPCLVGSSDFGALKIAGKY